MINLRQHGTAHRRDPRGNISGHPDARLPSRVGNSPPYQSLGMIRRQSRDNLSASSCA